MKPRVFKNSFYIADWKLQPLILDFVQMKLAEERLETMKDQVHPDLCMMVSWLQGEVVQLEV